MNGRPKRLDDDVFAASAEPLVSGLERVVVGFSGGADSTALLLLFADNAARLGVTVEALHFEHGIRGVASLEDAEWCRRFCSEAYPELSGGNPIPFSMVRLGVPSDSPNIEAVARDARLERWKDILRGDRASAAALGHHADDRMETLLMRLLRGGNVSSLAAPRASAILAGAKFIRPLLPFTRSAIEEYLENRGIRGWCGDATNEDVSIERNRVRRVVLPAFLGDPPDRASKGFVRSISALELDAEFIENEAEKAFGRLREKGGAKLPSAETAEIHPAVRARLFRLWLSEIHGRDVVPSADFLERMDDALERVGSSPTGEIVVPLDAAVGVAVSTEGVRALRDAAPRDLRPVDWNWKATPSISWSGWKFLAKMVDLGKSNARIDDSTNATAVFDLEFVPEAFVIRSRHPGDRMIPFGGDAPVRVKKLLEAAGTHGAEKGAAPVVAAPDGTILWLPFARRSNGFPVSNAASGRALLLKAIRPTRDA